MSRKLSVIIPVYNIEAYVGRTLESVFATDASADYFGIALLCLAEKVQVMPERFGRFRG